MVLCLIVGCRNKSGWDKGLYLAKVPSIIEKQGKEARELSYRTGFQRLAGMTTSRMPFQRTIMCVTNTSSLEKP